MNTEEEGGRRRLIAEFKARHGLSDFKMDTLRDLVDSGNVKRHVSNGGKREIWTVVGRNGDSLILPERHYCSCSDYYFRVPSDKATECYHLLAKDLAERLGSFETIQISDEEYPHFLGLLLSDILKNT
jgi:predicted nucleic acid-binding Zn finger protein